MIDSIEIKNAASYGPTPSKLDGLSQFNFIYGANGSGKTTISRVLGEDTRFPECKVTWLGASPLERLVYNRDFVDRNFGQSSELKGIFTLGEKDKTTLDKLAASKAELDKLNDEITKYTETLQGTDGKSGKKGELAALEAEFEEQCWALKVKYDDRFQAAFTGVRGRKQTFKEKILSEAKSNTAKVVPLKDLEKRAESVFGATPEKAPAVPEIVDGKLLALESSSILAKKVIGKTDVNIAAMIQKLGNSDWVKEGRAYYAINEGVCPFCQQKTEESLEKSLTEYFDEQFEKDTREIKDLLAEYKTESERIQQTLVGILNAPLKFLEHEKLKSEKEIFDSKVRLNIQQIEKKQRESSQTVVLESLSNVLVAIKALILSANDGVTKHNAMVSNLAQEKTTLTSEVWKHLLENEIKTHQSTYTNKGTALSKAIEALNQKTAQTREAVRAKSIEIQSLEKSTTSIQPTIDAINSLLASFGFQGFSLQKSEKKGYYKIVRADGTAAKETLSEGERTFITFLYFYHLLKGSDSETGMTADRIVVFDDPVSSLDSDVLFIVSNLIKGIFDDVRNGVGYIKQIFILTHNVYFHKEVTYNPNRKDVAMREETFWIVKKPGQFSTAQKHATNPIRTSYELLWTEVRNSNRPNLTIQNTLRRIVENYFKILGNINPDEICAKFSGRDKLICKSLFSWVNDGSHYAHDDIYISIDDSMVERYLAVFRSIFELSGHTAHYRMMMGDAFVEGMPTVAVAATH